MKDSIHCWLIMNPWPYVHWCNDVKQIEMLGHIFYFYFPCALKWFIVVKDFQICQTPQKGQYQGVAMANVIFCFYIQARKYSGYVTARAVLQTALPLISLLISAPSSSNMLNCQNQEAETLVTDPPRAFYTTSKNSPICVPPLNNVLTL